MNDEPFVVVEVGPDEDPPEEFYWWSFLTTKVTGADSLFNDHKLHRKRRNKSYVDIGGCRKQRGETWTFYVPARLIKPQENEMGEVSL